MVSRKWTIQLSLEFTLPMAAAAPPSAMTVCALPNSDLEMMAVRLPASRASIAARRPGAAGADHDDVVAVSFDVLSHRRQRPQLMKRRSGNQPAATAMHVEVGHGERAERDPGQLHVLGVELGDEAPGLVAHRVLRRSA